MTKKYKPIYDWAEAVFHAVRRCEAAKASKRSKRNGRVRESKKQRAMWSWRNFVYGKEEK